jgi:membrane fusion protein (multidrug efflux system)
VPSKAVVELMGEYFVYVVKDTTARDPNDSTKTHPVTVSIQKKVKLGQTIAPNVIIEDGLKEGTRIVIDGVQSLHTGSIINAGQKPDGAKGGKEGKEGMSKGDGSENKKDSSKHGA